MAGDSLPIQANVSRPHRAALQRCDRNHIRIEELGLLVFNIRIAAFA
jgi:hypothetical protein